MRGILLEIAQGKRNDCAVFCLRPFLWLLSLLYAICARAAYLGYARGLFPSYRPKVKVISVGNITLGGTGKTPFVKYLADNLSGDGRKAVILSRGYSLDEPLFLRKNLNAVEVITGRDRIKSAKKAQRDYPCDILILDDGFQHWRLKRDLDIVMINSQEGLGNRGLIPYGILREPVSSLRRADVFVLSKADGSNNAELITEDLKKINPGALIVQSIHQPEGIYSIDGKNAGFDIIKDKDICLLSGIGDPDSFSGMDVFKRANITLDLRYPDHYQYKDSDIRDICGACKRKDVRIILTTEKDLMRLGLLSFDPELRIFVLRIELKIINNEEGLITRIRGIFNR